MVAVRPSGRSVGLYGMRFTKYPLLLLLRLPTVAGFEPSIVDVVRQERPAHELAQLARVRRGVVHAVDDDVLDHSPRPDFRLWYLRDSVSRPSVCEVPAAEGRSVARRSCVGPCRDSARPTFGASSASFLIEAGTRQPSRLLPIAGACRRQPGASSPSAR